LVQDEEFCREIETAVQLYGEEVVMEALTQPIIEELNRA